MSQVTYTVGLLDAQAREVYGGTLVVQLGTGGSGFGPLAALLSLNGQEPLVLASVNGGGAGWSFYGSSSALDVGTSLLYGVGPSSGQVPGYLAGSIALTVSGQPQQDLLMMGFDAGAAAAPAPQAAARAEEAGAAQGVAGIPSQSYNFTLQLLNTSLGAAGSGTFTGTGQEVQIGPVSRQWRVTGTLTLNGGEAIAIQGWGSSSVWTGQGTTGGGAAVTLGFVPQTFLNGSADGTVTVSGETSFFVGTAVSAATVPVHGIAAPRRRAGLIRGTDKNKSDNAFCPPAVILMEAPARSLP